MSYGILTIALAGVVAGCQPSSTDENLAAGVTVHSENGGQPNLAVSPSGELLLSWVEYVNDSTDALLMSRLDNDGWTQPGEIARGRNWFVNWADFPSVVAFGDGKTLAAHWLQKSAEGTYDYDVRIAISTDNGNSWSESFIPHTDGVAAEHGFVSMIPVDSNRILAIWLDGRHMASNGGHDHGHGGGPMTLRSAEFDAGGNLYAEAELDNMVCECCQTDAAMTSAGPVVVYRDRDSSEVRDISIVRRVDEQWTSPQRLHRDHWEIAGCPVNGPAVDARDSIVAVAWFTAPEGVAQVNVLFSEDGGASFGQAVRADDGKPVGRVDIVLTEAGDALVSWIENTGEEGSIRVRRVNARGPVGESVHLHATSTSRRSGFPVLISNGDDLHMAFTAISGDRTGVSSKSVRLKQFAAQ